MKLVTAVIKPTRLEVVKQALEEIGVRGMTLTEVQGFGRQPGHTEVYRGTEYKVSFNPKIRIEILTDTFEADRVVDVLTEAARTGGIGDGKVWLTDVERVVRVRTGEENTEAV